MDAASVKKVIRGAQTLVRSAGAYIVIDGAWGARSEAAMVTLPAAKQQDVTNYVTDNGVDFAAVRAKAKRAQDSEGIWISEARAQAYANEAADYAGIPRDWLTFMLSREADKRRGPEGVELRVDSLSPSKEYKGLFQMGEASWADARSLKAFGFIGSFDRNWIDPRLNAYAAAGYALKNMGYSKSMYKYSGQYTPQIIYALHNQGHQFIRDAQNNRTGRYFKNQSGQARDDIVAAISQVRGTA